MIPTRAHPAAVGFSQESRSEVNNSPNFNAAGDAVAEQEIDIQIVGYASA